MQRFDSVIFDLDGTLWSSIDVCMKSLSQIQSKYPDIVQDVSAEQVRSAMGKTFDEIVRIYYDYLPKEKAEKYAREAFEQNVRNLQKSGANLYPGVQNTIQELAKNFKLCIVSNCIDGYIETFLDNHGMKDCFLDYESHGKTGLSKGENIRLVMERNHLKNAIYVGDTIGDKKAAGDAGIPFAYAAYGFGEVKEYNYKLEKIDDLLTILQNEKGGVEAGEK